MQHDDPSGDDPGARNLTWHAGALTAAARAQKIGQRGAVVWLTGLSGSGKSTVGMALEAALVGRGRVAYVLDGDNVRHGLCADLGFSAADRAENVRRVGHVAQLFADAGVVVIAAFISPYRADRQAIRDRLPDNAFFEVHLATDLAVCEARDPKGLYQRARAGEIADFTGISAPYEPPDTPELVLDTGAMDVPSCVAALEAMLAAANVWTR